MAHLLCITPTNRKRLEEEMQTEKQRADELVDQNKLMHSNLQALTGS